MIQHISKVMTARDETQPRFFHDTRSYGQRTEKDISKRREMHINELDLNNKTLTTKATKLAKLVNKFKRGFQKETIFITPCT